MNKLLCEKVLTPEHLQAIGMVAAEWSFLESVIDDAIWQYTGSEWNIGRCITTHLSLPGRLDILKSLFFEQFGNSEKYKELKSITKSIKDTHAPERNKIIHSPWHEPDEGKDLPQLVSIRARGELKIDLLSYEASDIRQIADSIEEIGNQLAYFVDINPLPPSSVHTP